ncbi:MAG: MFS transporter [Acidimicrobiales bacterium]
MSARTDALKPYVEGMFSPSRWWANLAHPVTALREIVGDGPLYALVVLFGLNAVDELDRTGFGILLPTIRDHFHMTDTGILSLVALTALGALLLQLPIAWWADRGSRVRLAVIGGIAWGVFSFATGLSATVWMLVLVRSGAGIGRAVVDPTHSSLLSDYFSVDRRPAVFSFHRAANSIGQFVGPLSAGLLSHYFGWRAPFLVFAVPTGIVVLLALRLREPVRGNQERRAMGASADAIDTEEPPASFGEAWRMVWKIESLRRIWYAIPFLAVSIIGFVSLAGLLYDRVYHYDDLQRGLLASCVEPFQLVGLAVGGRVGVRLLMKDPALVFRFLRYVAFVSGAWAALFAWSPNIVITVVANIGLTSTLAILLPGILASLSMAIPARARAVGFSVASYWAIPGLVFVPAIGWVSDHWGIRWGMLIMTPLMVIGGVMISTVATSIKRDIDDVWTASSTRSQALFSRRRGEVKLLLVKDLNVSYGSVQVLFDVSVEIGEGEVVALLGTNGAGKSTLLKAISGIVEADFGAVIFDGRDITHAPPHEIASFGVGQMPGGHGVFPTLTVAENLRAAGWMRRRDRAAVAAATELALDAFPVLRERFDEPAANLSGGQQQMLALAMNLLSAPRLLMIDELSLGLAPVVVERLAALVREVAAGGTTIVLVEQSINVALTLADTAYFMEKGEIRFSGPTTELLERPDLLRSVFLGKAIDAAASHHPAGTDGGDTGATGPALVTHDLSVAFGGIAAVDSVSIEVAPREIVGVIGPNGAGKTTLFDLICGFTPCDRGRVVLGGVDVGGSAPHRIAGRGLGRSFQDAALFGSLTVEETIAVGLDRWVGVKDPLSPVFRLPASVLSEDHVRRRVDELVELFDLGAHRHRFVRELSTGTRRVVDLACVVAHSPTVLLLDEPSSGIAQRESEALGPLISRLRDELDCAIVVIEHDMPLLASIADRLVALEAGSVIADGPVEDVLADDRVVASYLGTTAELIARSGAVAPGTTTRGAS